MELILWRHAEAEDGSPDLARALTPKGRKQAARVAEWLRQRLPSRCVLLASPAARAQQTAEALGGRVKTVERLAPGAAVADILAAAGWPEHKSAAVVVGHQPDLGRCAAYLVSGQHLEWSIKKGGLWWLSSRNRDAEAQVVVRAVVSPDLL